MVAIDNRGFIANHLLSVKGPCRVATTAAITLSGEQTIDGVAVEAEDRVLVKDQSSALQNGIYVCKTGEWELADDFDQRGHVVQGTRVFVISGTANGQTEWYVTTTGRPWPGREAISFAQFFGDPNLANARENLTADTTYTVGSGQDFATLQLAWDHLCANVDMGGFDATLDLIDGTHAGVTDIESDFVSARAPVGGGIVKIVGNTSTPGNVIITDNGQTGWSLHFTQSYVQLSGMEIRGSTSGGLASALRGVVRLGAGIRFGTCAAEHIHVSSGGQLNDLGNGYTIAGNAPKHYSCGSGGGQCRVTGTVTLSGTPAFSDQFAYCQGGTVLDLDGTTFSGSATGQRFYVDVGGLIKGSDNRTRLPGDVAGYVEAGGQYGTRSVIWEPTNDTPALLTGTSGSVSDYQASIIISPSGAFTLTLPAASSNSGRWLSLKLIASQSVSSASSNVRPLAGGAAGTAIFSGTAGQWAWLVSNGTDWVIMAAN